MKEGRKPEYPNKTPGVRIQKTQQTNAAATLQAVSCAVAVL